LVQNEIANSPVHQLTNCSKRSSWCRLRGAQSYRSLDERRFLDLFHDALAGAAFRSVEKVWLIVPEGFGAA